MSLVQNESAIKVMIANCNFYGYGLETKYLINEEEVVIMKCRKLKAINKWNQFFKIIFKKHQKLSDFVKRNIDLSCHFDDIGYFLKLKIHSKHCNQFTKMLRSIVRAN